MMKGFISEHIPLPERVREERMSSFEELVEDIPQIGWLIDSTEQERQEPKGKELKERFYSGRKKRHTRKTQVVVEEKDGMIMDISSGWEGRMHDLKVFESSRVWERFNGVRVVGMVDKGYVGIEGIVSEWEIEIPKKKPRGVELSEVRRRRIERRTEGG